MDNLLINIGNLIKEKRRLKGYSTQELAEKLGVSAGFINNLENGKNDSFNLHLLGNLCSLLDVSPISFIFNNLNSVDKLKLLEHVDAELVDGLTLIIEKYVQVAYNFSFNQEKVSLLNKKMLAELSNIVSQ